MSVADLIYFAFGCAGITWILKNGSIFDLVRPESELFRCAACLGVHVGVVMSILMRWSSLVDISPGVIDVVMLAGVSSASSYLLDRVTYVIDKTADDDGITVKVVGGRG